MGLALWRWVMVVCCERLQLLDVESRGGVTAGGRRTVRTPALASGMAER